MCCSFKLSLKQTQSIFVCNIPKCFVIFVASKWPPFPEFYKLHCLCAAVNIMKRGNILFQKTKWSLGSINHNKITIYTPIHHLILYSALIATLSLGTLYLGWILLKPVLGGVDGNLHFPVPSMNRLNQTESATFSILSCRTFFSDSVFSIWLPDILLTETT
jgi:hypothetical protein